MTLLSDFINNSIVGKENNDDRQRGGSHGLEGFGRTRVYRFCLLGNCFRYWRNWLKPSNRFLIRCVHFLFKALSVDPIWLIAVDESNEIHLVIVINS
jgi:hypothetical protein